MIIGPAYIRLHRGTNQCNSYVIAIVSAHFVGYYGCPFEIAMAGDRQIRREIVQFGRMMHERGYVSAMDGNLSVRLDEDRILCTPTAMCKGCLLYTSPSPRDS